MKKSILKTFSLLATSLLIVSCGGVSSETPTTENPTSISTSEQTSEVDKYTRSNPEVLVGLENKPRALVAPFVILNEDGSELVKEGVTTSFDNWYQAIRIAGQYTKSSQKLQVQDSNCLQIFIQQKASIYFVFTGEKYIGYSDKVSSEAYCKTDVYSYAIAGSGSGFKYLGRRNYEGSNEFTEVELETFSGGYNYMFSKTGVGLTEMKNGYSYVTCNVRLSEATYKLTTDGTGWNAYIFINLKANLNSDLGLIGSYNSNLKQIDWKMVRNCSSKQHTSGTSTNEKDAKFYVYHDKIVTSMKTYNEETKEFSGADDLKFEAIGLSDGWILNITNLRTNVVNSFEDRHTENVDGADVQLAENKGSEVYFRALLAVSFCPVVANVWNARCGAALRNVVYDEVLISRYIDDNVDSYRAKDVARYEFYPEEDVFDHGYSQCGDCSNYFYGKHKKDGQYKSGSDYQTNDKYISFSSYYDGVEKSGEIV